MAMSKASARRREEIARRNLYTVQMQQQRAQEAQYQADSVPNRDQPRLVVTGASSAPLHAGIADMQSPLIAAPAPQQQFDVYQAQPA